MSLMFLFSNSTSNHRWLWSCGLDVDKVTDVLEGGVRTATVVPGSSAVTAFDMPVFCRVTTLIRAKFSKRGRRRPWPSNVQAFSIVSLQ